MKLALDSNIMIYAEGLTDDSRNLVAQRVVAGISPDRLIIPVQAVSETLFWLIRKARLPRAEASERMRSWLVNYVSQSVTDDVMAAALELVAMHDIQVFDAVIFASASEAGAQVLLSEDMQHGYRWRGVTVVNPFLPDPHPLIKSLVAT